MNEHDHSYKLLFSHPRMVQDLLQGLVHDDWVGQTDFSTLERVSGSYVSDNLREREDDVIWRIRLGPEWLYVYLLIEFQSRPDPFMALRILVYTGLLYQELVKGGHFTHSGKLPPVFPLVLYNGEPPWGAAQEVSELIEAVPGLTEYRPHLVDLFLDEGRLGTNEVESGENLAAAPEPAREHPRAARPARGAWLAGALAASPGTAGPAQGLHVMDQAGAAAGPVCGNRAAGFAPSVPQVVQI